MVFKIYILHLFNWIIEENIPWMDNLSFPSHRYYQIIFFVMEIHFLSYTSLIRLRGLQNNCVCTFFTWVSISQSLRQKLRATHYFFNLFFFLFKRWKKLNRKCFFVDISLWIRSRATIWVVFEADYEIKLLVFTSGKKGDNTDIIKLKKVLVAYCFSRIQENQRVLFLSELLKTVV